jgi:hypothetical protein
MNRIIFYGLYSSVPVNAYRNFLHKVTCGTSFRDATTGTFAEYGMIFKCQFRFLYPPPSHNGDFNDFITMVPWVFLLIIHENLIEF